MATRGEIHTSGEPAWLPGPSRLACLRISDEALRRALASDLARLGYGVDIVASVGGAEIAPPFDLIVVDADALHEGDRFSPSPDTPASDARPVLIAAIDAADLTAIDRAGAAGFDEILLLPADVAHAAARLAFALRRAESARALARRSSDPGGRRYREVLGSAVRQARELTLLHEVRTALGRDLELPSIFRQVVEFTAATFGYTYVSVYVLEDQLTLVLQHQVGYDSVLNRIPVNLGVAGRVARTGQPVLLEDVSTDSAFLGAIGGITSEVCVPFFDKGLVAGILNIESVGDDRLGADDLRVMTAVSEHLSLAVERARLFETARASETRLRLAFESADMGTWEWNSATGDVRWSEQMGPLYGLPRGTAHLTAAQWYTLVHPADHQRMLQADQDSIERAADWETEFRVIHPETGDMRWLAAKGRAVERGPRGEATRLIGVTMDITGRKRLEQERLRSVQLETARAEAEEAERRITDTLERITAAFIALDPAGRLTYLNARAGELLGRPREEVIGCVFWDLFREVVGADFATRLRQAASTQSATEFDAFSPALNRWLVVHAYPAPEGLSIYLQDVTDRRRAEEELRRSEERFRALVQNASDVIVIVDHAGVVRYASPAMERIIGVPPEVVVGSDNLIRAHPDDVPRLRRAYVRVARSTGVNPPIELRFRHRDGSWRWLEITATNLFDEPGINGIVANCRDVTERKKAEDDLRFLAETSELLAASLDTETTLDTLVRQVVAHLADWCVVDAVDEKGNVRDIAVAHVDPQLEARLLDLRRRRPINLGAPIGPGASLRTRSPYLYTVLTEEDLVRTVDDPAAREEFRAFGYRSGIAVPLIARGVTLGALSFVSATPGRFGPSELALAEDLARRAALAMDNARLYRDAQTAIAARDQFMSVAAHELRTPITSINGFSELLRRELHGVAADPDRINRYVDRLVASGGRLGALVEDMLDVSRIQLGQLPLRLEPVDLADLVCRVASNYQEQRGDTRHRLMTAVPSGPCPIVADEDRLEQVLTNLLDNSVKYTPEGGEIRVALKPGDGTVRLTVSDSGIGLPPAELESIFRPFGRAENAVVDNLPGLGLGLYICRNIVERHGGRIWAESAGEGKGTTIVVWLPVPSASEPV
jgi:PAS domain S-box-containing protein